MHSDRFDDDQTESDKPAFALDKFWELDSVTDDLSQPWSSSATHGKAVQLDGQNPSDLVFLNHDFSTVSFARAGKAVNVRLIGECSVEVRLPKEGAVVECNQAKGASVASLD